MMARGMIDDLGVSAIYGGGASSSVRCDISNISAQDNGLIRSKLAGGLIILSGFVSAWVGSECVHYFNAVMGW